MKILIHLRLLPLLALCPFLATTIRAEHEIGFSESFALAPDRDAVLKQLIPGTDDYYYYHALHAQNQRHHDEVAALLKSWLERDPNTKNTPRYREIRHREMLFLYDRDPKAALDYLRRELGLEFLHEQDRPDAKPQAPTALDPKLVDRQAFLDALVKGKDTLSGVSDTGLDALLRSDWEFTPVQRRELLSRLERPDYPRLVGLVAADLRSRESQGFGEFKIHGLLLPEQLDQLLAAKPDLAQDQAFVSARIRKLHPGADTDWTRDTAERGAYLSRLWDYVKTLPPSFLSLKAHVLHQVLDHHRRRGDYPKELFLEYVKFHREAPYVNPRYLQQEGQRHLANLAEDFHEATLCPPVGNDEPLVRDYLLNLLVSEETWEGYAPWIRDTYLKPLFAEAKLTRGEGGAERWFSLLTPGAVQALKDRIDLAFVASNAAEFAPGDEVTLQLDVKNVPKLLVKVYELNALNYYLDKKEEIDTTLDLDGLTANEEQAYDYAEPPVRQVRRAFTFPTLKGKRGAWVVEFIGNGISSRALVRKGRLQYLSRVTGAGLEVTVLTEANQPAVKPSLWLGGQRYEPKGESKHIILPFSNAPGDQPVVLMDGDFASLERMEMPEEDYSLHAGFHVDRETLLPGREATVSIRPKLQLNGQLLPIGLLEEPKLVITSTDLEGVESRQAITGINLGDEAETLQTFRVPDRLASLEFTLEAKISRLSAGSEKAVLEDSSSTILPNGIDHSEYVAAAHLSQIGGRWRLEVLGKNGEPLPDRTLTLRLMHDDFQKNQAFALQTNAQGQIDLGMLPGIRRLEAQGQHFPLVSWLITRDTRVSAGVIHGKVGVPVSLPVMKTARAGQLSPEDLSVLEVRGETFVRNAFSSVRYEDGMAILENLSAGDYSIRLNDQGDDVLLRITDGTAEEGYLLSGHRHLEVKNPLPLQLVSLDANAESVRVRVLNPDEFTRVHITATRYLPQHDLLDRLGSGLDWSEPALIRHGEAESLYVSGRDIGEEYRYILERRAARKFPGNLLQPPALLLNPWALADTNTEVAEAAKGNFHEKKEMAPPSARKAGERPAAAAAMGSAPIANVTPNLGFLRQPSFVAYNLKPDANGMVTLKRSDLGDRQYLQVLATNAENSVMRTLSLPEDKTPALRDLRLTEALDPQRHFTQQRKVTRLEKGAQLVLPDLRGSDLETYDTLASVHSILVAASGNADVAEFSFLLDWPTLKEERKRELYSKYACHEMHFFLSRKDPGFFQQAVLPYLKNKKDKTFLDEYLLGRDLGRHLEPWAYGRLNVVERILLAQRLGGDEPGLVVRQIRDRLGLHPKNVDQENEWFYQALRGRRLSGGDAVGLAIHGHAHDDAFGGDPFGGTSAAAASVPTPAAAPAPAPAALMAPEGAAGAAPADGLFVEKARNPARGRALGAIALNWQLAEREEIRALFRQLEATKEWAENHYRHLPIGEQNADLITENPFWRDYSAWDGKGAFTSREFPAASRNFAEMWLALAVLDLPFVAEKHDLTIENNQLTLKAGGPILAFHEEVQETPLAEDRVPVLVSQSFFRASERYEMVDGEQTDKLVRDEFLTGVLYGAQVVVTNPATSTQKLEVLLQIPQGALPANGSDYLRSTPVRLDPYTTRKLEYFFYFPAASGEKSFTHYPAHVSKEGGVLAWAEPFRFQVVERPGVVDHSSWEHLSQFGTEAQVFDYLNQNNVEGLDLSRIAWRCRKDVDFLRRVTTLLHRRHRYDGTLWSYGIHHNVTPLAREYLHHQDGFLNQCGAWLECSLVKVDTLERGGYQHLEYLPLVNARAHQLGRDRRILNDRFLKQYRATMDRLTYRPELSDVEEASVAYYLFLQDRLEEGLDWLGRVAPENVDTRLQLDYLKAYAALHQEDVATAAEIAARHADEPVDRWRARFAQVAAQVKEIQGDAMTVTDPKDRGQQQEALAATEPQFSVEAKEGTVRMTYRHLKQARVNYYEMDLEFLFSGNPFVSQGGQRFSYIRPNMSELKDLPADRDSLELAIPERFASRNVLVEIVGAGRRLYAPVYANSLRVDLTEAYGQVQVRHAADGKPLPKVYVKVYARGKDGEVRFHKDGYTDLRGKFDYASLSTNDLENAERLSLLILSESHGAVVREAEPPRR